PRRRASCRFPAASLPCPRAFFPRRPPLTPGWGRAAAGKKCSLPSPPRGAPGRVWCQGRCRSVGVAVGPGARPERPSIRGGPATAPSTLYRLRLGRQAKALLGLGDLLVPPGQVARRQRAIAGLWGRLGGTGQQPLVPAEFPGDIQGGA